LGLVALPLYVRQLDQLEDNFHAMLENGDVIGAKNVVLAIGMGYFKNQPSEMTAILPKGRYRHTCDAVRFDGLKGKRVLILGGRQSAFEWAALLNDKGASEVHLVHRHESPKFTASDWTWVPPLVDGMVENPAWFRNLPQEEKDLISKRMWGEGRLKVEPWLEKRVMKPNTYIHAKAQVISCTESKNGALNIQLSNGESFIVDEVILATGYKVDIEKVPFLKRGNLLEKISAHNGFPVLDEYFQTSVPGLFMTSMPAGQDFGPFFAFTVSVRTSAKIIGKTVHASP
jgi:thioredoxin reductase